jgi:NAD(P)-dependent dehydrogenase (short-subunit alcohol dehydrogenase family)
MTDETAPRHALVTGAGKRVGAAIARALAKAGWGVTVHYRTARDEADALGRSIREIGVPFRTYCADFSDAAQAEGMIAAIEADGPPLSLLVNNAAVFSYDEAGAVTAESLAAHFTVNTIAPILIAQAFGKARKARGEEGVVINLIDNKIFAPNADYFSYSVAKFALAGATKMLAMALAPEVRVCGVAPAVLLVSGEQTEEDYSRTNAINPLKAATALDDVCRAVLFLAEARSISGQIIAVDGGQSLMNLPRDIAFLDEAIIKKFQ